MVILQTENSNRRLQFDLRALEKQFGSEFLQHLFIRTIEGEELLSLSNPAAIESIIRKVQPNIIGWDPLRDIMIGNPNDDRDMMETVVALGKIAGAAIRIARLSLFTMPSRVRPAPPSRRAGSVLASHVTARCSSAGLGRRSTSLQAIRIITIPS